MANPVKSIYQSQFKAQSRYVALVVFRVLLGAFYLLAAVDKFQRDYARSLETIFYSHWQDRAVGFYQPFLDTLVLPHLGAWSTIVTWGELGIAIGFLFGFLTRIAAAGAILLHINIILASMGLFDSLFIGLAVLMLWAGAGRYLGLDGLLRQRETYPRRLRDWIS